MLRLLCPCVKPYHQIKYFKNVFRDVLKRFFASAMVAVVIDKHSVVSFNRHGVVCSTPYEIINYCQVSQVVSNENSIAYCKISMLLLKKL